MPMTFGDLRTETLGWLDEAAALSTDQSYINVTNALKQAHTLRLTQEPWKFMLWPKTETFSTVSGTQVYPLHQEFLRGYSFRNTTQRIFLTETPSRNIEPDGIDWDNDANTGAFVLTGRSQVANQPTSASVIRIVSSSASDTTAAKAITITGDTANGVTSETLTPNGTTPVSGTTSFTTILSVTKGAAWVGTMTMTSNSAAVTNLVLFPAEYGRSYPQMRLLYLPTGSETISYRFYRRPRELSAANDITDIPPPFERILVFDALLMLGAYDNRLDGGRIGLWTRMRDDLYNQLSEAQKEGNTLGAEPRLIGGTGGFRRVSFPD